MDKKKKIIEILKSEIQTSSVVFDSPHSGSEYPDDFNFACDIDDLRMAEDMYVDELFSHAPQNGSVLLKALFPRSYIDPNRSLPVEGSINEKNGRGLCRTVCNGINNVPIYDNNYSMTSAEKEKRIEDYYDEYHENLRNIIETTHKKFNKVIHINCHSMPSPNQDGSYKNEDIILGSRNGKTCSDELLNFVKTELEIMGYNVAVNIKGYRGAEIVKRHSKPENNIHSIQFEIKRNLYMNEETFEKTDNFNNLKQDIETLYKKLSDYSFKTQPIIKNNNKLGRSF